MLATWLILLSALLHAGWNVAIRRSRDGAAATVVVLAGTALLTAVAAWLAHGDAGAVRAAAAWGLGAGAAEGVYFLALGQALQVGPLGPVYAVSRGLPLLLLWPLSHAALGEPIGTREVLSVALLLLGLIALAPSRGRRGTSLAGYAWASLCAAAIAANTLLYKEALIRGADPSVLFAVAMAAALPLCVVGVALGRRRAWPRVCAAWLQMPMILAAAAVASSVSFFLSLYVMKTNGAAWVVTLRNSSIAFAQILAWLWLGERPSGRVLLGVGLILGGALLLGF